MNILVKKILKFTGNIFFAFLIIAAASSLYYGIQARRNPHVIPSIFGYKPMSVLSGSMRPLLEPGDMIVVKDIKPTDVSNGDVITYKVDETTLVTHRVVNIVETNGEVMFETKGDANNTEDGGLVTSKQLVGALAFNIPKGGYLTSFVRSPYGFVLLILIPIFLLIIGEIKSLSSEVNIKEKNKTIHKDDMKI